MNLKNLEQFFEDFQHVKEKARANFTQNEIAAFAALFDGISNAQIKDNEIKLNEAPNFNLFKILKISHLEDRVHSPFLANLFNPTGSHGQGSLFLNELIKYLLPDIPIGEIHEVQVSEEYHTYDGIFDILIQFKVLSKPFYLVIENKIYAGDQNLQLKRYNDVLKKLFLVTDNYLLIYLTPTGKNPTEGSLPAELHDELIRVKTFRCVSYAADVNKILWNCVQHIKAPIVAQTIIQYLRTIKNIHYGFL